MRILLVLSLPIWSMACAVQPLPATAAPTAPAAPQLAPPAQKPPDPPRRPGKVPAALVEQLGDATRRVNTAAALTAEAAAKFERSSPEVKTERAARAKLAETVAAIAAQVPVKLDPACFSNLIDDGARKQCFADRKLWLLLPSGEIEAQ